MQATKPKKYRPRAVGVDASDAVNRRFSALSARLGVKKATLFGALLHMWSEMTTDQQYAALASYAETDPSSPPVPAA